jgi:hypothetical protein
MQPDELVSMNMWGFTTDIFGYLFDNFVNFLKESLNVPKSESFLPMAVADLIDRKVKNVKVLASEDKWYGVTYKEDKDAVVSAISALEQQGLYDNM